MKKYNFTIDYFIKKFSKIPKKQWCVGQLENDKGQKCALGHCGVIDIIALNNGIGPSEAVALFKIEPNIALYNNGMYALEAAHPRTRVLNRLKQLKRSV